MRKALVFAAILSVSGCIAPITPMERLQQSANDVASALRFDRTDLVAEYCAPKARDAFLERHAVWTDKTRIGDLELSGIYRRSPDEPEASLEVAVLESDERVGTVLTDRVCTRCYFNLVSQPVIRERHYGLLVVRCPECGTLASVQEYPHVIRWADEIARRPAVQRGRKVNRTWGEPSSQLHERHDASDFELRTQDRMAP